MAASVSSRMGKAVLTVVGAKTRAQGRQALWGYAFVAPWVIGLAVFTVGPVLSALYLSFTEFDGLTDATWVGLANYAKAAFDDDLFWPSLGRTLYYAVVTVPLSTLGSLLFALLLNQAIPGKNLFRTVFFVPHLTPIAASAVLWTFVLHPYMGPVNMILGNLGLPEPGWLTETGWAIPSIIMISLWSSWGGNRMLIFLAGLQSVPSELVEAAEIDGANAWHRFWNVTLPMISSTMFFNLVLGVIGALKVFGLAFVATRGGPYYATWFFALHIYVQSFDYYRMGYGCALAWIFALILLILTYLQIRFSDRWVYYASR